MRVKMSITHTVGLEHLRRVMGMPSFVRDCQQLLREGPSFVEKWVLQ